MTADQPAALRDLAVRLATAAGELALPGTAGDAFDRKSSATDLVTEYDRAAERLLVEQLREARPDDGIVGEEGAAVAGTSGLVWYVDPIDGTTNYVHGHPMWATSVAVERAGAMLAGAVYAPALGDVFAAAAGLGATRNGESISTRHADELAGAVIATGFAYEVDRRRTQARRLVTLIGDVADIRRGGSAALDLCFVAAGYVDGYYEEFLNAWDLAAGVLIAVEAGCLAGVMGGDADPSGIVVAPAGIFEALRTMLATTK